MAIIDLLAKKPDVENFWEQNGVVLEAIGVTKKDVVDIEALTDLMLIVKVMNGDIAAKKYIDEKAGAERRAQSLKDRTAKR